MGCKHRETQQGGNSKSNLEPKTNGKAPGPDGISAEILKEDVNTSTQMLYEIYAEVMEEETTPKDY